jgi:hypothetical protein
MTKKQFKKHIKRLLELKKEVDRVEDLVNDSPLNNNLGYISFGIGEYEAFIVDILEDAMEDNGEWISYFLYERDAKFSKKKIITLEDGKGYAIDSLDALYNLITNK